MKHHTNTSPLRSALCGALITAILFTSTLHAAPPPPKGSITIGSIVRLIAISKTQLYYLVITQEEYAEEAGTNRLAKLSRRAKGAGKGKTTATAACIVAVNTARALKAARGAQSQMVSSVAADVLAGRIRGDLATQLRANLTADLVGQFRVTPINSTQLRQLLGSPAMVTGKVAMLSDLPTDVASAIVGAAGLAAGGQAAAGMVASTVQAGVLVSAGGVATGSLSGAAAGAAVAGGALAAGVVVAGAGGYVVGSGVNTVITATLPSYNGQSTYTLGDAIYDFFFGDDDTPDAPAPADAAAAPAPPPPAPAADANNGGTAPTTPPASGGGASGGGSGSTDNSGGGGGTTSNDGTSTSSTDDDGDSDDDSDDDTDNSEGTTTSGSEGAGTSLPPDMENGSALGTLVMYAATGLCRGEMQRQLAAIDISNGGALGVDRQKATDLHWDRMLGGLYLNTLLRGVQTQRNKHGQREPVGAIVVLPDKRLFINGLVCPPPQLDYIVVKAAAVAK